MGVAAGMGLARRRLAEDALIGDLAIAVDVTAGRAARRSGADRDAIGRQLIEARAEPRIDIFVDDFGRWLDMGIGVIDPQPVLHHAPSLYACCVLYTPGRGRAETP